MSSRPPHLPIAITARRTRSAASPSSARAIARAASRVPAARSESSAAASSTPRPWVRSREATRSSTRRYSTRSASTAAAVSIAAVGRSAWGSAPTDRSSPARTAKAAGRVDPSSGSASSFHCSGCRTRWSDSAWLAPSTLSRRIAVPSSSTSAPTSASPPSAASRSRTSPASAALGSAVWDSGASNGSTSWPSRCRSASAASESSKPSRSRLPLLVAGRFNPRSSSVRRRARRGRRRAAATRARARPWPRRCQ